MPPVILQPRIVTIDDSSGARALAQSRLEAHRNVLESRGVGPLNTLGDLELNGQVLALPGIVLPAAPGLSLPAAESPTPIGVLLPSSSPTRLVPGFVEAGLPPGARRLDLVSSLAEADTLGLDVAYFVADTITLADDAVVVLNQPHQFLTFIAERIVVGQRVLFTYAHPTPGANVWSWTPGDRPPTPGKAPTPPHHYWTDATPGVSGTEGVAGWYGIDAPEIELWVLELSGSPSFDLRGQDGWPGGRGRDGGHGGDGSDGIAEQYDFIGFCRSGAGWGGDGGSGGNGGNGGSGGPGGSGGRLRMYAPAPVLQTYAAGGFSISTEGGSGGQGGGPGAPGSGGQGGRLGDRPKNCPMSENRTDGSPGRQGALGQVGPVGATGGRYLDAVGFVPISSDDFRRKLTEPALVSAAPNRGVAGTTVTLTARRLTPDDVLLIDEVAVAMTVVADTLATFVVPAVRGGNRVLRVRQSDGTRSNRLSFTILPQITAVGGGGRERPGSTVTVTGSGFAEGARVRVNGEDMPDSTFVNAETMTFTLRRPAHTPDGPDGEPGRCEVILADGTASAPVGFIIDTLRVVVIGDSVAWGQGLHEQHKHAALVGQAMSAQLGGIKVYPTMLAHSGAIIGIGDATVLAQLPGEVPTSYPTAMQQIEMVTGDLGSVDLVLLTCGLNDVDFRTIINPLTATSAIAAAVDVHCRSDLFEQLVATARRFPQASIVVSGYYPILSEDSDTTEIRAFLVAGGVSLAGLPGGVLGAVLIPQIINNCRTFHELSTAAIATAVDEANATLRTPRILFADTGFGPENAAFASDPWLFAINGDLAPQDAVSGDRGVLCRLDPTRTNVFQCERASIGHPNTAGAQAYADSILAALAAGPLAPPTDQDRTGLGFADVHCHQFAHLGFGGRAFWGNPQGGIAEALGPCEPVHGAFGLLDVVGNVVRALHGHSIIGHGVKGHPEFDGWPRWDSFTHQAVHEEWLHRAVRGGLRLMVMLAVSNEPMSNLVARAPGRTSNDMEAVDLQLQAARAMEAHVDEVSGGAGQGWYRIVETADEALSVIESGRLAVVLGIEVDYLFNCHTESDLTPDQLRADLDKYYDLGVRHLFPVHFGDNGFGGAAFQNGLERSTGGGPVSPRNPLGTLDFYTIHTEDAGTPGFEYRANRRNVRGLTELGRVLIQEMIERGMIIDIDHMSAYTRNDTLDSWIFARRPGTRD